MASKKKKTVTKKLGWHFLPSDMKLEYSDGRIAAVGQTLSIPSNKTPKCCSVGMHASEKASDASFFDKGPVLTRVEVSGDISSQHDKFCGRSRKVLWAKKITAADLIKFAKTVNYTMGLNSKNYDDDDITAELHDLASAFPDKFDAWTATLLKGTSYAPPPPPPAFTKVVLLSLLMPGVVQSKKQILASVGKYYDLNNDSDDDAWGFDRFDDIIEDDAGGQIIVVEGWANDGNDGFVLKQPKRKR